MKSHHILFLLVVFALGYAASRYFPQAAHAVGMP